MTSRVLNLAATEYVSIPLVCDVQQTTQPVHFSFDNGVTWTVAAWTGTAVQDSTTLLWTRTARLLVAGTTLVRPGIYKILARVTDNPEIPVIECGGLAVR